MDEFEIEIKLSWKTSRPSATRLDNNKKISFIMNLHSLPAVMFVSQTNAWDLQNDMILLKQNMKQLTKFIYPPPI